MSTKPSISNSAIDQSEPIPNKVSGRVVVVVVVTVLLLLLSFSDFTLPFRLACDAGNMRNVNDFGSYCPQYDRPEQGLDLLTEAIASAGLTPGTDDNVI